MEMFNNCEKKLEDIYEYINTRKEGKLKTKAEVIEYLVDSLNLRELLQKPIWLKVAGFEGDTYLSFEESIQLMDSGFKCDDKCSSCKICVQICPVGNIRLSDGKPTWQHQCEQCFACLQWCPEEAIQFRNGTSQEKRYHHPDVKLSDMIINEQKNYN